MAGGSGCAGSFLAVNGMPHAGGGGAGTSGNNSGAGGSGICIIAVPI